MQTQDHTPPAVSDKCLRDSTNDFTTGCFTPTKFTFLRLISRESQYVVSGGKHRNRGTLAWCRSQRDPHSCRIMPSSWRFGGSCSCGLRRPPCEWAGYVRASAPGRSFHCLRCRLAVSFRLTCRMRDPLISTPHDPRSCEVETLVCAAAVRGTFSTMLASRESERTFFHPAPHNGCHLYQMDQV